MDTNILEELGLSNTEAKTYLALLELGETTTGSIIDKTNLQSSTVYHVLGSLIEAGLVTYVIKGKTKHYSAAAPETLQNFLQEKQRRLSQAMPQLHELQARAQNKQSVKLYEGFNGLQSAFANMLNTLEEGDTYRFFQVEDIALHKKEIRRFFRSYHLKRAEKGVSVKRIIPRSTAYRDEKDFLSDIQNTHTKYTDEVTPVGTVIYKDHVLIIEWDEEPTVITIQSKTIAENYVRFFEQVWNKQTAVVQGADAIQRLFEEMLEAGHCDFIAAQGYFIEHRPKYVDEWEQRAIRSGFTMRNIVDESTRGHRITKFPFAQTKYTLDKAFSELSVFWIYGDKVAISNWASDEPTATIIEKPEIVAMYKKQFEILWNEKATTT